MRALGLAVVLAVSGGLLFSQSLFQKPVKVLGDPNFIGTAANPQALDTIGPNWVEGRELNAPAGVAVDNSVSPPILYIADTSNNRILGYQYASQTTGGPQADLIIGQVDRYANQAQGPSTGRSTGLTRPSGLAVDGSGNLYVMDTGNNRILRFPQPFAPANSNEFPNMVIGQKSFQTATANSGGIGASTLSTSSGSRSGITFDSAGNLWVSDTGNNRVLRFPAAVLSAGSNYPAADLVVGQTDFVTTTGATTKNSLTALGAPNGIAVDSSGNLFVSDQGSRVLVFNGPVATGATAATILGFDPSPPPVQASPKMLTNPAGIAIVAGAPLIADPGNNRLLGYFAQTPWVGGTTSPAGATVVGQTNLFFNKANQGNGDASALTLSGPLDAAVSSSELYVADSGNNRVLVFPVGAGGVGPAASRVIGQADFPYTGVNLVDARGLQLPSSFPSGIAIDYSSSPARMYVADTFNNRVLGYKDFRRYVTGQAADLVLGQPDFLRSSPNYPSGQTTTPNSSGLSLPTGLAVDSAGNVYVSDTGNARIVRFPAPYSATGPAPEAADLVLGQPNFTSIITDATALTLGQPAGIALTAGGANANSQTGYLVVADNSQNRVLMFAKPFSSGMRASNVIGQSDFNSSSSGAGSTGLGSPKWVTVDPQDRIIVADSGNARIQIFGQASSLPVTGAVASVSIAGQFSNPLSVATSPSGDFWVTDFSAGNILHFPSVSNLALQGTSSDGSLAVLRPHSAIVDSSGNLVVADGVSRILYFAPQTNLTNAGSYSTRALAAGTIAAMFPAVTTNSIANGTAPAPAGKFPLPVSLSDTQVNINGNPIPLLYVSPGQNNVIMPQSLPSSGTADVQVVKTSTGQVMAAAELQLASASPALFTSAATGSGQALAVNVKDGSVNGPLHPVLRGQFLILYGTGVGAVPNGPADGTAATGQAASDLPTVLIASSGTTAFVNAPVTYSGLAPGFAGLWQINVQIPVSAQSGNSVTIKVFEHDIPNLDQGSSLTTTIAVQ